MAMRLLGLGALYEDTVLTLPHFPAEDSKLRATARTTRLGGNILNTFGVLSSSPPSTPGAAPPFALRFCAAVGNQPSCAWIASELQRRAIAPALVYRAAVTGPATALVLCAADTGTRTVVSHANALDDPTAAELYHAATAAHVAPWWPGWIHVEGRNCEPVAQLLERVADRAGGYPCRISVDFERPRPGLWELMPRADVLFVSQTWARYVAVAEAAGGADLVQRVVAVVGLAMRQRAVCYVTLGGAGCYCFSRVPAEGTTPADAGFWLARVPAVALAPGAAVETVGAGDTFIAGVLWALVAGYDWVAAARLATELAAAKCATVGFEGLWEAPRVVRWLAENRPAGNAADWGVVSGMR
ncbi:Ribokinase-like protein [Geopyxis carbonaria]|nr:Ribokinase-like protein [Geopyxis carbonaria]